MNVENIHPIASEWPLPPDEEGRLRALRNLGVLRTPSDPAYEAIVDAAAAAFRAPIALITLVDEGCQWFKARKGLGVEETSRGVSFCAHTILGDESMVVGDATLDPRFADNGLVTGEPGIRFYAGAPLRLSNGWNVGSLCVIDTVARWGGTHPIPLLEGLAGTVVRLMELQASVRELTEELRERDSGDPR